MPPPHRGVCPEGAVWLLFVAEEPEGVLLRWQREDEERQSEVPSGAAA